MKTVFIFPPQWDIRYPSTGIPTLMGVLSEMGVECIVYDLNIDFFNYILKPKHILDAIKKSKEIVENRDNKYDPKKVAYIKNMLESCLKYKNINTLIYKIETITNLIKNKNGIFDYKSKEISQYYINIALKILSFPYYPYIIRTKGFSNVLINLGASEYSSNFKNAAEDKDLNIFLEYMEYKIPNLKIENGDLVCISINSTDQLLGALTTIKIIRKMYDVKIAIGGSWIDYELINIKNDKELFTRYVDYCMTGLGEIAVKELWEHHIGKRNIKDVSNIIYFENGNIYQTKNVNKLNKKIGKYNYNGYDFSQYYLSEPILPIKVSYGCYWGKCKFCNYNSGKVYDPKSVDDVIQEIEELMKKYNVKYFHFQDAALHPKFIEEFADKIISKKIKIRYLTNLRFEEEFDKKLLKKLYKSGLRIAQWGLETASPKILNKYNKGIKVSTVIRILKDAYKIGIFNHLYLIYNFPGETWDDFMMTINFINKYKKEVKSYAFHSFVICRDTYIYEHPEEFSINPEDIKNKDFVSYSMICNENENVKEKDEIVEKEAYKLKKTPQYMIYNSSLNGASMLPEIDKIPLKYLNTLYMFEKIKNKIISGYKTLIQHK